MATSRCTSSCLLGSIMLYFSQSVFAVDATDTITIGPVEQVQLKLSDLPGVNTRPTMNPSGSDSTVGIASTGRVHSPGRTRADNAHLPALEARRQSGPQRNQQLLNLVFTDSGVATLKKIPWPGLATPSTSVLSSAGIGFSWVDDDNFVVKVNYAFKPGGQSISSVPGKSSRLSLQAFIYF